MNMQTLLFSVWRKKRGGFIWKLLYRDATSPGMSFILIATTQTSSQRKKRGENQERTTQERGWTEWRAAHKQRLSLIESFMSSRPAAMECCACAAALIGSLAVEQGRVRASTLAICKNGLIHFPHERVSQGRHRTSQSTQIYGPLKQQADLTAMPLWAGC